MWHVPQMLKNAPWLAVSGSVSEVQVCTAHFGTLVSTVTTYSDWNSRVKESVWLVNAYRAVMLALVHAVRLARLWVAVLHAVILLKMRLVNLGYILLKIILKLGELLFC